MCRVFSRRDPYVCCIDQKLLAKSIHCSSIRRRRNNLSVESTDTQWSGRVTGSKASGSGDGSRV